MRDGRIEDDGLVHTGLGDASGPTFGTPGDSSPA
jgi:hypothetical protein